MHTGQFSLSGPVIPMLKILEENSAAKDCTRIEDLPDVCFVIMGQVREERKTGGDEERREVMRRRGGGEKRR